jgi:hypothetical protein
VVAHINELAATLDDITIDYIIHVKDIMKRILNNQYIAGLFCLLLVLVLPTKINAQRWTRTEVLKDTTSLNMKLSYLATIKHPGIAIGVDLPISKKEYYKNEKLKKTKEQFLTSNLSYYYHKTFHSNFLLSVGYLYRRTNSHNWFFDVEPQIGLSRTILGGTTYEVDNNGNVSQNKFAGYWYFNSQLAFSIGKDFSKQAKPIPLKLFLRPNLLLMLPYNNYIYVRPTIELGIRITNPKFPKRTISYKRFNK